MPLSKPILGALKRLGAALPDDAASMAPLAVLERAEWPRGDLETKTIDGTLWFEPRRLAFCSARAFVDDEGRPEPGLVVIGTTDHQQLVVRTDEAGRLEAKDLEVLVVDHEEPSERLGLPLSKLAANLRKKKPTPESLKKLVAGIEAPNVALVREALREGADPNAPVRRDILISPLVLCIRNAGRSEQMPEIARALLEAGGDANAPLVIATLLGATGQHLESFDGVAAELFARGTRIPAGHPQSTSPIFGAEPKTVERMIDHGLDPNAVHQVSYVTPWIHVSALCEAAWRVGHDMAEMLLRRGADPNYVAEPYGLTPLHFAVVSREAARVVPLLLEHGARDRRSNPLPEGMFRVDGAPISIPEPGLHARELAARIGRDEIAAAIAGRGAPG